MTELNGITLYWRGRNYCCYHDSDNVNSGYEINTKNTIKWIKEDGAKIITVVVVNNDPEIPIQKRLNKISKECGYDVIDKSYMNKSPATGKEWFIYKYQLIKLSFYFQFWHEGKLRKGIRRKCVIFYQICM